MAVRCLVRAAECLLLPTRERKACALLWCSRAMLHIAAADPDEQARILAEQVVHQVMAAKQDEEPLA